MLRASIIATTLFLQTWCGSVMAQQCASGQLMTHEAYQYGRFETRMQSAQGNGIVSAFFLYNIDLGCNWPAENNEIDIEMTGNRDDSVQFTTHYPGPWSATEIVPMAFNPHAGLHDYAIEWEPGVVRWFVDDELVYVQDAGYVSGLVYPMRILMNHYAADAPGWVGAWDAAVLPTEVSYDYVRYYAYTPGSGDAGTDNNFMLQWSDEFDQFDPSRWQITEFGGFGGNFCTFISNNIDLEGGQLQLHMTEPPQQTTSAVSFSVDVTALDMAPTDVIYLNGTFNDWCGTCNPMSDVDGDGTWELSLMLPAGEHEYLYSRNGWSDIGGAPLGSACDYKPCDEWSNYGVAVPYGSGAIETETFCWGSCESCADADEDGVGAAVDNCQDVANSSQVDSDNDGFGNRCDGDLNNDCAVNFADLSLFKNVMFSADATADLDSDGAVNFADLVILKSLFFAAPGPSALANCP
ncbi:MAG: family 16 glycosylhydrolase [Gammaproteobacteria bacterium]|nr:family 16 glycosylhydrolase [Gammaproteobacteria bacterium]